MDFKYNSLSSAVYWKKKGDVDSNTKRWLDNDSLVNFKLKERTLQNAEFVVNGNPNHIIWFSQLSEIFLHLKTFQLYSGELKQKDGTITALCNMNINDFINYINGKTFRVRVNAEGDCAKFDKETLPSNKLYTEIANNIAELVNRGDIKRAAQYLLPASSYDLYEI